MPVILEYYPLLKQAHVVAVVGSASLFVLRGLAVQGAAAWPMAAPVRYLSYGVDVTLLTAALMLLAALPAAVFANGWLWVKLSLLVVYIASVAVRGFAARRRDRIETTPATSIPPSTESSEL